MSQRIRIWAASLLVSLFLVVPMSAFAGGSKASAYFVWPHDGATVSSTFTAVFGLRGMGVAPAGTKKAKTGHFHLIIDSALPAAGKPIGKSDKLKHFGGGQTETTVKLSKGKHTLQLIMGDHGHVPHKPAVTSNKITVWVK